MECPVFFKESYSLIFPNLLNVMDFLYQEIKLNNLIADKSNQKPIRLSQINGADLRITVMTRSTKAFFLVGISRSLEWRGLMI